MTKPISKSHIQTKTLDPTTKNQALWCTWETRETILRKTWALPIQENTPQAH
jgi:hypothetical protein